MDLVLGFNIFENCNFLLSLENNITNQKLYKQFIFLLHKDYKSFEFISDDEFKIIKKTIEYYDKKDELFLLSRFSQYINANYGDRDQSIKNSVFINVVKSSLELEGLLKHIFNIIKLNIKHFNKEISIEIIKNIINYFKTNLVYGIDHFSLFLSILLFKDFIELNQYKELFKEDIISIFDKFRNAEFFVKFKFAQQTKYNEKEGKEDEILIYGHFQNNLKIRIKDKYIEFLLQVLENSTKNYRESLYILLTVAYKLQTKYYNQLFDNLYNENEIMVYKSQKLLKINFKFKPIEDYKEEEEKEKEEKKIEDLEEVLDRIKKINNNENNNENNNDNGENILKYFLNSLILNNKFNFGYYLILINSINERKIYEFGKFYSLLFQHLKLEIIFQLFQVCLNEFFYSTIKNVYKLLLINWNEQGFKEILQNHRFLESEFNSIVPDIYRFCYEALKSTNFEKNLETIFFGDRSQFKDKYEMIEKNYLNQLLRILDINLINKFIFKENRFQELCLGSNIYQFKKQYHIDTLQTTTSNTYNCSILPNYLIQNIFYTYLSSSDIGLNNKLVLLFINKKYFETVRNFINYSLPITIKYTSSIKKLKSIGCSSNSNWSILQFDKLENLKILVLKEGQYIEFKNFSIFKQLKSIHFIMENVVAFLSQGLIKRILLIDGLEKAIFTISLSRITKEILKEFIYLADQLNKKFEFHINETFTMNDEYISLDILSNAHKNIKITKISTTLNSFLSKYTSTYSNATDNFSIEIPQSLYQGEYYSREEDTKSLLKNDQQKISLKKIKYLEFKMHSNQIASILELLEHMDSLVSLSFIFSSLSSKNDTEDLIIKIFNSISKFSKIKYITIKDDRGFCLDIDWLNLNILPFYSNNFKYFFK